LPPVVSSAELDDPTAVVSALAAVDVVPVSAPVEPVVPDAELAAPSSPHATSSHAAQGSLEIARTVGRARPRNMPGQRISRRRARAREDLRGREGAVRTPNTTSLRPW
jgi:hypothetical protein